MPKLSALDSVATVLNQAQPAFLPVVYNGVTYKMPIDLNTLRENSNVLNAQRHGCMPDGTDISQNFMDMIGSNRTIVFGAGTYKISSPVVIANAGGLQNLIILAEPNTIFTGPGENLMHLHSAISNFQMGGIRFVSSMVDNSEKSSGLVLIENFTSADLMEDILVHNCRFTNPQVKSNGMKVVVEGNGAVLKRMRVTNNKFIDVGRFGIETQNHVFAPVSARIKDYMIDTNYFERVGTIQASSSQDAVTAISVSGYQRRGKILNNTIIDMMQNTTPKNYAGIENAGTIGLEIAGNIMESENYGFTGITNNGAPAGNSDGLPQCSACSYHHNTLILTGPNVLTCRGFALKDLIKSDIHHNDIFTDGYAMYLTNCSNNTIKDNTCFVKDAYIIYLTHSTGQVSTRNIISGNNLDNQASSVDTGGQIACNGSGVSGNYIKGNFGVKSGGGAILQHDYNGAANNIQVADQ